ncbi:probable E3 ubiquitin-protein ligase EDA40 isoform X2 [Ricinus communis]|uniref:probable E3 ubiquitin-protein ligase EDA40 isoform X2 n=1 Tax=Ricinus communis TaxID=3988 RepID=UPI000772339B|nr:probable E3 ubiquitin-protein ligase EDA40 isoform X2 [Ricinus communis]|eukprot:XP_015578458.1 probable E3 ubiquitin-protein ligase EDA40 isoform X2 [Ricinus communis]
MGMGGASSKLRKAARKMVVAACASFSSSSSSRKPALSFDNSSSSSFNGSDSIAMSPTKLKEAESLTNDTYNNVASKNLCAICLEALSYSTGNSPGQAIFTAQCSHAFHFACISSNVRHGSVTCPICRAHWTQLPRNLNPPCSLSCNQSDPIFQILDDSIATFRVHRRSFLRSARYNDDDPIEPDDTSSHPRLDFSLVSIPPLPFRHRCTQYQHPHHITGSSSSLFSYPPTPYSYTSNRRLAAAYLSVKSIQQRAMDLVLVASPNGPHLRLVKQSMALVVFSLRPIDRLAVVTYSSFAARVFPLRRMTSYGKRTALQVIDRLFFMGQADPMEGLKKGIKILEDRAHKNPQSCLLHLSDSPTRSYHTFNMQIPFPIHRFHVGFGFGTSNGFVMHEFEEFLVRLLGGVIRDVQLRIGEEGRIIRLGELRGNEERRILLDLGEREHVFVGYSYVEDGNDECAITGETIVSVAEKREPHDTSREAPAGRDVNIIGGRTSSVESWDYHDPYMARRWAKHLHGYRL